MSEIERSQRLIAQFNEKKRAEEAKRLFELLPQGTGSGLNADFLRGLTPQEIIARAVGGGMGMGGTGGVGGVTDHGALTGLADDDHPQYTPYLTLISDQTLGANVQRVTFTNLDLEAAIEYLLVVFFHNPAGSNSHCDLYYNGDEVATNYWTQQFTLNGLNITTLRANTGKIILVPPNEEGYARIHIKKIAGYEAFATSIFQFRRSTIQRREYSHRWGNTANVTSFAIVSNQATGLGDGGRFTLYRLGV